MHPDPDGLGHSHVHPRARERPAARRHRRTGRLGQDGAGDRPVPCAAAGALGRRRHQRHLHARGRGDRATGRRDRRRPHPRRRDRLLPAHRDPRRHLGQHRRDRGAVRGPSRPRRRDRGIGRRQPHGDLQPGAGRRADLRARRGRRRQGAPQGRPGRDPLRPARDQQDRSGPVRRRRPRRHVLGRGQGPRRGRRPCCSRWSRTRERGRWRRSSRSASEGSPACRRRA